jgi:hypothetical protein
VRERLLVSVRRARAPLFVVQAQNDHDTPPTEVLAQELAKAGHPGRGKVFPPHGQTEMEGHAHFCNHGMSEWGNDVLTFLRDAEPRAAK